MSEKYSDFRSCQLIFQVLIEDDYSEEAKLNAVKDLKNLFTSVLRTNHIQSYMKLESLLDNINQFQDNRNITKELLYSYGMSLINILGRNAAIDFKILQQIESVFLRLKENNEEILNALIQTLWNKFKSVSISSKFLKKFVCYFQTILEDVVLNWIEGVNPSENFFRMSASSPELFQAVTAILNQVLIKTQTHCIVLELITLFVKSVFSVCVREQKDFIKLYPRDCRRLVSLLIIPPDMYPSGDKNGKLVTRNLVGGLLVETIFQSNDRGFVLLSHYPDWLKVVKMYLDENYY